MRKFLTGLLLTLACFPAFAETVNVTKISFPNPGSNNVAFYWDYTKPAGQQATAATLGDNCSIVSGVFNCTGGSAPVTSVFGRIGAVTAQSGDYNTSQVTENTNLYFTTARARASLSAGAGISYSNVTGIITNSAPDQTVVLTNGTGISVTGTYPNFTITNTQPSSGGTVTSIATTSPITGGTITNTGTIGITQSTTSTNGYLSSADWNTFNGKQAAGNYITALTGDGTASGPGSSAFTLSTVATPGTKGSASKTVTQTINAKGLTTSLTDQDIQITESQVTNLVSDLAGKQPIGSYLTSVAVATSNGFAGSSSGGTTPTITLSTTVTGIVKGNGTTLSAATAGTDYVTASSANTFTNKSGNISQWTNDSGYLTASTGVSSFSGDGTIFNNSLSTGAVTATLISQVKNTVLSGPTTGSNAAPTFRTLVGADLPNPSATTLGGVQSITAVSHNFLTSISTSGVPAQGQPAFSDISGTIATGQVSGSYTGITGVGTLTAGTASTGFVVGGVTMTLGSDATGDVYYRDSGGILHRLGIGSTGNVLTVAGGLPSWAAPATSGTVTSVTFTGDGTILSSTPSSAVTTSGTVTASLNTQTANKVLAGPTSGGAATPTFRSLVGTDLPNPSSSTLGGIQSYAAVSNQWINTISTAGVPSSTQPAFSNISGTATVSQGGTGAGTLTGIVIGNGTSAFTTVTAPSGTVVGTTDTQTLTNKRITLRIGTETSSSATAINSDIYDQWNITALAAADTISAPSGTPTDGQQLVIRILDNGTARALTWNSAFRASSDLALPTTTILSKTLYCGFKWNAAASKWDLLAYLNNF